MVSGSTVSTLTNIAVTGSLLSFPRGHALRAPIRFEQLLKYDLIALERSTAMMRLLSDGASAAGQRDPDIADSDAQRTTSA